MSNLHYFKWTFLALHFIFDTRCQFVYVNIKPLFGTPIINVDLVMCCCYSIIWEWIKMKHSQQTTLDGLVTPGVSTIKTWLSWGRQWSGEVCEKSILDTSTSKMNPLKKSLLILLFKNPNLELHWRKLRYSSLLFLLFKCVCEHMSVKIQLRFHNDPNLNLAIIDVKAVFVCHI